MSKRVGTCCRSIPAYIDPCRGPTCTYAHTTYTHIYVYIVITCAHRDEPEEEDVAAAAVVALQHRLAQGRLRVEAHRLVARLDQVLHDVGACVCVILVIGVGVWSGRACIIIPSNHRSTHPNPFHPTITQKSTQQRTRGVPAGVAEPLVALHTLHHAGRVVDAAVPARVLGQLHIFLPLLLLILRPFLPLSVLLVLYFVFFLYFG